MSQTETTTETLTITLRPDMDLVHALVADDERGGDEELYLGRYVPAAAVPRLERYVARATELILERWPHAEVKTSGEDLRTGGATPGADVRTDGDSTAIGEEIFHLRQVAYEAACEG